jgi:hypothetical protein
MISCAGTPVSRSQARFHSMTRAVVSRTKMGTASVSMSWWAKARSGIAPEESMRRCIVVVLVMSRPSVLSVEQLLADENRLCARDNSVS